MCSRRVVRYITCLITVFLFSTLGAKAQRFAVHTDALQWAILSPNVAFEAALAQHHALSFSASACPVKVSDLASLTHFSIEPQYKYWFRMPFYGHYVGASMLYSSYDLFLGKTARTGNLLAACADYGYSLIIGRRWNLVPHVGLGLGVDLGEQTRFVPLVAKIGINIQLVVK